MDKARRQTLKRITGVAVASSAGLVLSNSAIAVTAGQIANQHEVASDAISLSNIKVHTRVSAISNDLEVVISNIGRETARITQMTPSQTSTARGTFDFSRLMQDGALTIDAGQSVSVPMTPHTSGVTMADAPAAHARSITNSLRASFSVVTDNDAYAMVDVVDGLRFT